jgi:hypothetical protein
MDAEKSAIAAKLQISFNDIGAVRHSLLKGRDGVLRKENPVAAVSHNIWLWAIGKVEP